MKEPYFGALFRNGAKPWYHPYPQPSSNLSECYTNPEGLKLQQCAFCGFCERYACEHFAKASPQTVILPALSIGQTMSYERTAGPAHQSGLNPQEGNRRHLRGCRGVEYEQPADLVLITAFRSTMSHALLSEIGNL